MAKLLKRTVKSVFETFGLSIIGRNTLDQLVARANPFCAQKRLAKKAEVVIFDVGAHVGETTKLYAELFPKSTIYETCGRIETFTPSIWGLRTGAGIYNSIAIPSLRQILFSRPTSPLMQLGGWRL